MSTWEEIGQKWNRAQKLGWEAVQAALDVGDELIEKQQQLIYEKGKKNGNLEFYRKSDVLGLTQPRVSELTRLALHRKLIESKQPDSMNAALKAIPKLPTKVGKKAVEQHQEELSQYEEYSKLTAKKQALVLAEKMVKVRMDEFRNEATDALTSEVKALKNKLNEERQRIRKLMQEADEKQMFYNDLINKRMNGFDHKAGLKVLRQAVHPDRENASAAVKNRAMNVIEKLARFFDG